MKRIQSLILLLLLCTAGFAQRPVELSFSASPSFNWMSPDQREVQNNKTKLGYEFGVNGDFYFDVDSRYAFHTGLLINKSGGELTYNTEDDFNFAGESFAPGTNIRYRLTYLEIPTALKLRTNQFYRWTYWGLFGLSTQFNVAAKADSSDGLLDKSGVGSEVRFFNVSLNVGVGAEYDLGERNALLLGLQYKNGFSDVTKSSIGGKTTVNSLTLKFGLLF